MLALLLIGLLGCKKETIKGDWYKFLVYQDGKRTGQFMLYVVKDNGIGMYQDSERERIVYRGHIENDSVLLLKDVINGNADLFGVYRDTVIELMQYDFTYIGTKQ